jgi:hypothetical protein
MTDDTSPFPGDEPAGNETKKGKAKTERTIEQQIADYEAKLKRLKQRREQQETGRKIVTGALTIEAARRDPATRRWLRGLYEQHLTRVKDRERIQPLYDELCEIDNIKPKNLKPTTDENDSQGQDKGESDDQDESTGDNLDPVNKPD